MSAHCDGADAVLDVLSQVEALPERATGALVFGLHPNISGVVLLEQGRVCWATAHGMRHRLTDLLRECCDPPMNYLEMERVFQQCKEQNKPMGETLVEYGLIDPEALRAALLRHTAESLAASTCWTSQPRWVEHRSRGYQSAYTFLPTELIGYASECAKGSKRVAQVQAELETLAGERDAAVFDGLGETLLACRLREGSLRSLKAAGDWASRSLVDQSARSEVLKFVFDPHGGTWLGWRDGGLTYLVRCVDRLDFSELMKCLMRRGWTSAVQSSVPMTALH